jgi:hypothetical protein
MFRLGDLTQGPHLFPFRTEKLSLVVPMILLVGKVGNRQDEAFDFFILKTLQLGVFFVFCL